MEHFLISTLISISNFLGVGQYPPEDNIWEIDQEWQSANDGFYSTTISASISDLDCQNNEQALVFPPVFHGFHKIYVDKKLVAQYGFQDGRGAMSFYGAPIVRCGLLNGEQLTWVATSPTKYYARLGAWPKKEVTPTTLHKDEILNISAFGALIILSLYLLTVTNGTPLARQGIFLSAFALSMSVFYFFSISGVLGLRISFSFAHRGAMVSLGTAAIFFARFLFIRGVLFNSIYRFSLIAISALVLCIFLAQTSDGVQALTMIMFLPIGVMLWVALFKESITFFRYRDSTAIYAIFGLFGFVAAATLDIVTTSGILVLPMMLPAGIVCSVFFLSRLIQLEIRKTYKELQFLRANLEDEVEKKTTELRKKKDELEGAMNDLRSAQAELVQSAKLASLGTLAAGIAHEINNAINYVNGSLPGLERIINKSANEEQRQKAQVILGAIKDGTKLTVDIVRSLRFYTGINQAKVNVVLIKDVINSVATILKQKFSAKKITLQCQVQDEMKLLTDQVAFNQILMNLLTNALDASPPNGLILVDVVQKSQSIELSITDSGPGISGEVKDRIFDPFFTTKGIGSGTGLGLYIVKKELTRLGGEISVENRPGGGACFRVKLPLESNQSIEGAA